MVELSTSKAVFIVIISVLLFTLICVILFISHIQYVKNKLRAEHDIQKKLLDNQELERLRISSDLHDILGISISTINMNLNHLNDSIKYATIHSINYNPTELNVEITTAQKATNILLQLTQKAYQELREAVYDIYPYSLESNGLINTINQFNTVYKKKNIVFDMISEGNEVVFGKSSRVYLFRIIQELCNNTLKHANATMVFITISYHKTTTQITYTDNGKGISDIEAHKKGFGMQTLKLRTQHLNGTVSFEHNKPSGVMYFFTFENSNLI